MADTHINAFFADVDEAEKKVLAAHAAWEEAKARLETKKKEVDFQEPIDTPPEPVEKEQSRMAEPARPNNLFKKR